MKSQSSEGHVFFGEAFLNYYYYYYYFLVYFQKCLHVFVVVFMLLGCVERQLSSHSTRPVSQCLYGCFALTQYFHSSVSVN